MLKLLTSLFMLLAAVALPAAAEDELLAPEDAFPLTVEAIDADTLRAEWNVADGYYVYRSKFRFDSETPGITLGDAEFPPGKVKHDEFFGEVEVYRGRVAATIPVQRSDAGAATLKLTAASQGCADIGVCYPPFRQTVDVQLPPRQAAAASPLGDLLGNDLGAGGGGEDEVLDPDVAFRFSAEVVDGDTLKARWDIAREHYLYREKFTFELKDAEGVTIAQTAIPKGKEKDDEFFGRIQVFYDEVEATLDLARGDTAPTEVTLVAGYQGCAEIGICYPPMKKEASLALPAATAATAASAPQTPVADTPAATAPAEPVSEQDSLAQSLASGNTLLVLLTFFGLGLLLAFTPCVFPMIPILSSIIVGQGEGMTTRKAFVLSTVYVLAMAATYTIAGVIAGLFGANIQAAFQNPWVLSSFAAVFVALSLSMFGFYELQLPSALQSKLTEVSNRQQGGTLAGVAIMGLLSALIVGPCVAPPLMGALIYIGQTGDPWLGGAALFALSMGMGAPLVAIGTAGGKLLPRAGGWMDAVKAVFGVLLLAVAVWMLERILPAYVTVLLWALLAVVSAIYMGALEPIREGASGWKKLWKGLGVALLAWGILLLVGLAGGGRDPLAPLAHMGSFSGAAVASAGPAQPAHLAFERIKSVEDLQREVAKASAAGQPVMLDFYADWCVSCKELEKYTFSDPQVIDTLEGVKLLQADVTANDETDQALLRHFNLIGPPAILFWNTQGEEKRGYRVVGFKGPEEFAAHVRQALGR